MNGIGISDDAKREVARIANEMEAERNTLNINDFCFFTTGEGPRMLVINIDTAISGSVQDGIVVKYYNARTGSFERNSFKRDELVKSHIRPVIR